MNILKNKKIIRYWREIVLALLAIVFFVATSSYNYTVQKDDFVKWSSPDETANYIFAKLYGQTGEIKIFEEYNLYAEDIIHPRSFRSDLGFLKPVSFLGIILIYGKIASFTSYKILPFLTPLFAAIGIVYFYLLIKKIFSRRNAFISAWLLAFFPVYIYYSARSMFHNVLFVVLLIVGLYYAVLMVSSKSKRKSLFYLYSALGGFFIGLSLITRSSELIWIAPMLFIIWIFNFRKVGFIKLLIFLSFLSLAILPAFYWNQVLYSSPINGGYSAMNQSIAEITQAGGDLVKSSSNGNSSYFITFLKKIKANIFYFGFDSEQSWLMFKYYFVKMFYYLFWPAILGLFLFVQNFFKWKKKHFVYFLSLSIISIILIFYYGSWEFHDNPDPNSFTIGNSYTRYWLPIYLGFIPFFSLFLIRLSRSLLSWYDFGAKKLNKFFTLPSKAFLINTIRIIVVSLFAFISVNFLLFGSDEGLIYSVQKSCTAKAEAQEVLNLTESSSVIITNYHDKVLFPERKVILGLFDDKNMNERYAKVAQYLPLYYYNFSLNQDAIDYLNSRRLKEVDLNITEVKRINQDFTLYKLERVDID